MDTDVKDALFVIEKKLEEIETKIDELADEVADIKEDIPASLDDDLAETRSLLIQIG